MWAGEEPVADAVLDAEDDWRERERDIVEVDGHRSGNFTAPENPGDEDGKQGLERKEGREAHENTDGNSSGNGVRCVVQLDQFAEVAAEECDNMVLHAKSVTPQRGG